MCGIIGVTNSPAAAEEIFLGLQNLQHRGQDGGGIVTYDNGSFYEHRGAGLLDIAFPPENFKKLIGKAGVGHTRYATIGHKESLKMLQPFFSQASGVAIGHNGNILNYHSLKEGILKSSPESLASGCDSELILWALSQGLDTHGRTPEGLKKSVTDLSKQLVGSYSVVGYAQGIGLFAFRDPQGLRPLMIGERAEPDNDISYAFASETMALEFIGYDTVGNVAAGELVIAEPGKPMYRENYAEAPKKHCMFEWVYFARVESHLDHLSVYQARFNLGIALADAVRLEGIKPDIVVPVPETSRISAIALAESLNVPFREVLIKNRYVNRTFILESQAARQEAIRRKLYPVASELKGKKVLIVDDSIVRGNTAIKIIDLLRKCGAEEIYLASSCPPIKFPCYYGVDFPNQDELLAGKYSQEELKGHLGVDALIYQTLPGLRKALETESLCDACLTGDYPTDVTEAETFSEQRTLEREVVTHAESPMTLTYQGSVKNVYQDTRTSGVNYFAFTDDYSIFDWGKMPDQIANKGKALSMMGGAFFRHLTKPTSWERLPEQESLKRFDAEFLASVFQTDSYQRLKQAGLQHHFLGWVNPEGEPNKIEQLAQTPDAPMMKVRSIDVTRPRKFTLDQHTLYNYDQLGTPSYGHPFLIPLEVIFRFGMPEGSSMSERLDANPHYYAEIGLNVPPQPNTWFARPVVEFFTKLEAKDRYLTPQEAFFLSGLAETQFVQLYDKTLLIALWLYDAFSQMGIELWDGKIEMAWTPEGLMLVDSIGPDELRLKMDDVHLSKEAIRQFYRGSQWEESLKKAKADCLSRPGSDWRDLCETHYQATPDTLTSEQKRIIDSLYGALANRILGETIIPTELTLDEVVQALKQQPVGAC